ncbi:hypothetical protein CHS0354_036954 [Potamilus streckersoni]|uniref:Uncharacterized protein n=1 Tax=Potamilus streckersoni TaxID=2493646 RepID=A0AAE0TCH2_9BIVA|nr:hypothetical protein CHS0354_036954 [Potamilus streckersoni]
MKGRFERLHGHAKDAPICAENQRANSLDLGPTDTNTTLVFVNVSFTNTKATKAQNTNTNTKIE